MTPTMRGDRRGGVTNGHGRGNKQKTDRKAPQGVSIGSRMAPEVGASGTEDDFYDPKSGTSSSDSSSSSSSSSSPPAPSMAAVIGGERTMTVKGIAKGLQAIELTSGGEASKGGGESTPPFADASSSPLGSAIEHGDNEEIEFAEFVEAPIAASMSPLQGPDSSSSNLMTGKSREEIIKILQEQAEVPQPWTDEKDTFSKVVAKYRSESERILFIRPEELQPIREAVRQFDEAAIGRDLKQS